MTKKALIQLYQKRIKINSRYLNGKTGPLATHTFQKSINHYQKMIELLSRNKMTPEEFSKLGSRDRWEISEVLKNVQWICGHCGADQNKPERCFPEGVERYCSHCHNILTRRTPGGQSDPLYYSFKK